MWLAYTTSNDDVESDILAHLTLNLITVYENLMLSVRFYLCFYCHFYFFSYPYFQI
jgi:hypothetical protein